MLTYANEPKSDLLLPLWQCLSSHRSLSLPLLPHPEAHLTHVPREKHLSVLFSFVFSSLKSCLHLEFLLAFLFLLILLYQVL